MSIKICLDAGHSSKFCGARGNGLKEEDIVLDIVLKVGKRLEEKGIKVIYTRKDGNPMDKTNNSQDLITRCNYANNNKVDYFISIHNNCASSSMATGNETLYNSRFANSKVLANNIQTQLTMNTKMRDRGLKNRTDLAVLNRTQMSACLIEVGFLSNPSDALKLKDNSFIEIVVNSIVNGIFKTCGITNEITNDKKLEDAIYKLIDKKIKIQFENWKSVSVMDMDNVPVLIERFGGVDYLIQNKIIQNPDIWINKTYNASHVRMLIIKCGEMLDFSTPSSDGKDKIQRCIETISKYAVENYKNSKVLPSLVIAQACWESGYLTSELAINAKNPFGMKYNSDLDTVGSYSYKGSKWCIFNTLEHAVQQQGKFYNLYNRYKGIVGECNIDKVLNALEQSGYCEGTGYSENIKRMIDKYDLTKYDKKVMMKQYDILNVSSDESYQKAIKNFFNVKITTQESWYKVLTTQYTEALLKRTGNHMYNTNTYKDAVLAMRKDGILSSKIWDNIDEVKAIHLRSFIIKVSKML